MAKGQSHLHCWASGVFSSAFVTQPPGSCRAPAGRLLNPQLQPWLHGLVQPKNPPALRHTDRETTQMCCLKDPQGAAAPNCQSSPQERLHSPVLQHRARWAGGSWARGSSSFLKLPWGYRVWGEGRRPAGPGSCGAAMGTPEGTALATALPSRAGAQGEELSHARPIGAGWAQSRALGVCPAVQQGWARPGRAGAADPALL